jgi:hypothetical protein
MWVRVSTLRWQHAHRSRRAGGRVAVIDFAPEQSGSMAPIAGSAWEHLTDVLGRAEGHGEKSCSRKRVRGARHGDAGTVYWRRLLEEAGFDVKAEPIRRLNESLHRQHP